MTDAPLSADLALIQRITAFAVRRVGVDTLTDHDHFHDINSTRRPGQSR